MKTIFKDFFMKHWLCGVCCLLALNAAAQNEIPLSDTIPFTLNDQNTLAVKAVFNDTDTLDMNFDTGTTELVLTQDALKGKVKSQPSLYDTPYSLRIGKQVYHARVYDAVLSGHGTDGRFGWDLFDGKVVELDYDHNLMIVHTQLPARLRQDKTFTKLVLKPLAGLFLMESTLSQDGTESKDWFLFDTGYQRTAMLDDELLREHHFPAGNMKEIKKVMMKGAQGNEVPVITSELSALRIGDFTLEKVPVQQITGNKPMRGHNIHILGNEVLKRFNIVMDFREYVVYLQPGSRYHDPYVEKS